MQYGLSITTDPATEPVSVDEIKQHSRIDYDDEDALIESLITAARQSAETYTGRQFIKATYAMTLASFPGAVDAICMPRSPVVSVDSITYTDAEGNEQTLAATDYTLHEVYGVWRIVPAYGLSWPVARCHPESVAVEFQAGYGALATDVPEAVKQAITMLAGDLYEHREAHVEQRLYENLTVRSLLDTVRVMEVV